jgi:hypothetical protein
VIQGKRDAYFRVDEFAVMIGRAEKTVRNWAADGRLAFVYLFGVPLVSLALVESLIDGRAETSTVAGDAALRVIGRRDRAGRRTEPERHRRQRRMTGESAAGSLLHSSKPPVGSSQP